MAFKSKISEEEREQMFQWASEGVRYTEIVKRLGGKITKQRVQQLCRRGGFDSMAVRKQEMIQEHERKRRMRLDSFYKESDDDVDFDTWIRVYNRFKEKVKAATWAFDIEFSHIEFSKVCPILGIELDYKTHGKENSAEFDRIDSTKGYVLGNVWVISRRANRIKNDGTAEEHRLISNAMFARGAI